MSTPTGPQLPPSAAEAGPAAPFPEKEGHPADSPDAPGGSAGSIGRSLLLSALSAGTAGAAVLLLSAYSTWPREAILMSGIFVLAALLWTTEALPLFATSLLVIGLEMLLLANPGQWRGLGFENAPSPTWQSILNAAADPVLLLFFGGFLLARSAVREGVDRSMAAILLRPFGTSPALVLLGIMLSTAVFSMWMSNTATAAMMMALLTPLLAQMDPRERFGKALLLGVAFGANLGGMGTPIASPPNAVAVGYLKKAGADVSFLAWMAIAVPLMLALLLATWALLYVLFRPRTGDLRLEISRPPLTGRAVYVVIVFTITVLLWMSEPWHGLPVAVVALLPAVALTATGFLDRQDVNSLEWNVLILIAGGIALGAGMSLTGLDAILVRTLTAGGALSSPFTAIALLVFTTLAIGTFMSNTAVANLLLPIGVSWAATQAAGGDAAAAGAGANGGTGTAAALITQAGVSIALAASVTMALPVSTPPNAMAFAHGRLTVRDMAIPGILIGLLTVLLITAFGGPIIRFWKEFLP